MTPEQHAQRVRQLELQLELADFGMGMPRDYEKVLALRQMLNDAINDWKEAEHMDSDGFNEQMGGY